MDLRTTIAAAIWDTWRRSDISPDYAKDVSLADLDAMSIMAKDTDVPVRLLALAMAEADAAIAAMPDPWIDIATLGDPVPGLWPWDGSQVMLACRPREGQEPTCSTAWYRHDKADNTWDWWWYGYGPETYTAAPISETNEPITHVRRIVPPGGGA